MITTSLTDSEFVKVLQDISPTHSQRSIILEAGIRIESLCAALEMSEVMPLEPLLESFNVDGKDRSALPSNPHTPPSHKKLGPKTCPRCESRHRTGEWPGAKCAFSSTDKVFGDSYLCGTIGRLFWVCHSPLPVGVPTGRISTQTNHDESTATLSLVDVALDGDPVSLWLSWHKSRGSMQAAWLLFADAPPRKPTLQECEKVLEYFTEDSSGEY